MITIPMSVAADSAAISMNVAATSAAVPCEMEAVVTVLPTPYRGGYVVTPTAEEQVLEVQGMSMVQNLVVNPIPNNYGRITWNGSTLTVS